jgi:hypothetical protein
MRVFPLSFFQKKCPNSIILFKIVENSFGLIRLSRDSVNVSFTATTSIADFPDIPINSAKRINSAWRMIRLNYSAAVLTFHKPSANHNKLTHQ